MSRASAAPTQVSKAAAIPKSDRQGMVRVLRGAVPRLEYRRVPPPAGFAQELPPDVDDLGEPGHLEDLVDERTRPGQLQAAAPRTEAPVHGQEHPQHAAGYGLHATQIHAQPADRAALYQAEELRDDLVLGQARQLDRR